MTEAARPIATARLVAADWWWYDESGAVVRQLNAHQIGGCQEAARLLRAALEESGISVGQMGAVPNGRLITAYAPEDRRDVEARVDAYLATQTPSGATASSPEGPEGVPSGLGCPAGTPEVARLVPSDGDMSPETVASEAALEAAANGASAREATETYDRVLDALRGVTPEVVATARLEQLLGDPAAAERARWIAESPTMGILGVIGTGASVVTDVARRLRHLCAADLGQEVVVSVTQRIITAWASGSSHQYTPGSRDPRVQYDGILTLTVSDGVATLTTIGERPEQAAQWPAEAGDDELLDAAAIHADWAGWVVTGWRREGDGWVLTGAHMPERMTTSSGTGLPEVTQDVPDQAGRPDAAGGAAPSGGTGADRDGVPGPHPVYLIADIVTDADRDEVRAMLAGTGSRATPHYWLARANCYLADSYRAFGAQLGETAGGECTTWTRRTYAALEQLLGLSERAEGLPTCGPAPALSGWTAMTAARRSLLRQVGLGDITAEAGQARDLLSDRNVSARIAGALATGWAEEGKMLRPGKRQYQLTDAGRDACAAWDAARGGAS